MVRGTFWDLFRVAPLCQNKKKSKKRNRDKNRRKAIARADIMAECGVQALPDELLARLMRTLTCSDRILSCASVSKRWRAVALDDRSVGRRPCLARDVYAECKAETLGRRAGRLVHPVGRPHMAAHVGHLDCVVDVCRAEGGHRVDLGTCLAALVRGHADVLAWAMGRRRWAFWNAAVYVTLQRAIWRDHADALDVALARCPEGEREAVRRALLWQILEVGRPACARVAEAHGWPLPVASCRIAARCGNVVMLDYARERGCPWVFCPDTHGNHVIRTLDCDSVMESTDCRIEWDFIVWDDRVGVIEYGLRNGWTPTQNHILEAIRASSWDTIALLQEASACPWDADMARAMASWGRMDVLHEAREHGCPWDERACEAAVTQGYDRILAYLHENGCPWDWQACLSVALDSECRAYLYDHKGPCDHRCVQ
jgi:hypothetical protein